MNTCAILELASHLDTSMSALLVQQKEFPIRSYAIHIDPNPLLLQVYEQDIDTFLTQTECLVINLTQLNVAEREWQVVYDVIKKTKKVLLVLAHLPSFLCVQTLSKLSLESGCLIAFYLSKHFIFDYPIQTYIDTQTSLSSIYLSIQDTKPHSLESILYQILPLFPRLTENPFQVSNQEIVSVLDEVDFLSLKLKQWGGFTAYLMYRKELSLCMKEVRLVAPQQITHLLYEKNHLSTHIQYARSRSFDKIQTLPFEPHPYFLAAIECLCHSVCHPITLSLFQLRNASLLKDQISSSL